MARTQTKLLTPTQLAAKKAATETKKQDAFIRLFEKRVTAACTKIDIVGNCSGSGYSYVVEQVNQGITIMAERLKACAARFNKAAKTVETGFKLLTPEQLKAKTK